MVFKKIVKFFKLIRNNIVNIFRVFFVSFSQNFLNYYGTIKLNLNQITCSFIFYGLFFKVNFKSSKPVDFN